MRYIINELNDRYQTLERAMEAEWKCQPIDRPPWTATRISAEGSVDALEDHITNPPYGGKGLRLYRCATCGRRTASNERGQVVGLNCMSVACCGDVRTHQQYQPKRARKTRGRGA